MLGRPHVCLRCQIRLAKRFTRSRAFQSTRGAKLSSATATAPADRVEVSDNQDRRENNDTGHGVEMENGKDKATSHSYKFSTVKPRLSEFPLGQTFGNHGRLQRSATENLDATVLGEPAKVIVLRDTLVQRSSKYYSDEAPELEALKAERIDILAALDNERGIAGRLEVNANIDQHRPKEGREPETLEALHELVLDISSGFTVQQLSYYIDSFNSVIGEKPVVPIAAPKTGFQSITPWLPDISSSNERLDQQFGRGYSSASYTGKQRLALQLVRQCWKLEVPELEEGIGEQEVQLSPQDFNLLLNGRAHASGQSTLATISSKYITDDRETIEGYRGRHTLRITTTRAKSSLIVHEIEQALKNIRRTVIDLKDLLPPLPNYSKGLFTEWRYQNFENEIIREKLSAITNTEIKRFSNARLTAAYVADNPDYHLSNPLDTVRRLLLTSWDFSDRTSTSLNCQEPLSEASGTFVQYTMSEGFPWRDRLRTWSRWTVPALKRDEGKTKPTTANTASNPDDKYVNRDRRITVLRQGERSNGKVYGHEPKTSPSPKNKPFWHTHRIESSCILGHIIYSQESNSLGSQSLQDLVNKDQLEVQRAFATTVPNISRILGSQSSIPGILSDANGITTQSVVLRFLPNPSQRDPRHPTKSPGAKAVSLYPPVKMHFSIDSDDKMELKDITASLMTDNSDIMLPDCNVDIRFQQTTTSRLKAWRNDMPQSISKFLKESEISNRSFRSTDFYPPKATFPIAKHLFKSKKEKRGTSDNSHNTRDVEYLYAGMEIRNTITMDYQGWVMHYTSIDTKLGGGSSPEGKRGELRLLPERTTKARGDGKFSEDSFLKSAFMLAEAMGEGQPIMRWTPDNDTKGSRKDSIFPKRVQISYAGERTGNEGVVELEGLGELKL